MTGRADTRTVRWAATLLAAVTATTVLTAAPAHAETYSAYLRTAVVNLPLATEVRTGYDRSLFPH
ncbi:hypothetical protein AB0L34_29280 [Micromonospora sp. NPDC052213]|uniref:hypothetical protein n=1 Tax=Micromonospora sp. NPDC052213 TaxID=3155812 RepID=UPI00341F5DAA